MRIPLDLVGCGDYVYALTNDGTGAMLQQFGFVTDPTTGAQLTFDSTSTAGNPMSCHRDTGGEENILEHRWNGQLKHLQRCPSGQLNQMVGTTLQARYTLIF